MIFDNHEALKGRVKELTGRPIYGKPQIITDISDFTKVRGSTILRLEGNDYFVRGSATEGRFTIDDQPKPWVKYLVDLDSGRRMLIKMEFFEEFSTRVGPFLVRCKRNPSKEAKVLAHVGDNPYFMHGRIVRDALGNPARLIEFVKGPSLYRYLYGLEMDHETYYHQVFPGLFRRLLESVRQLAWLMDLGFQHGDVRSDHLIMEADTGRLVWIDFDYQVSYDHYDLWCLGNVITFLAGKGAHSLHEVCDHPDRYVGCRLGITLGPDDGLLASSNQLACLGKVFPYIAPELQHILVNFSWGTEHYYESVHELISDLEAAEAALARPDAGPGPAIL